MRLENYISQLQTWEKEGGGRQRLKMKNLVGITDVSLEEMG